MESSRKLTDLLPEVELKISAFIARCANAGIDILITNTYRDNDAQHELWKIGREINGEPCNCGGITLPLGSCAMHPLGRIVTMANGGESFHNYKVAADFVPIVNGKPNWTNKELFTKCGEIAESLGLEWAGRWKNFKELAHVQFTTSLTIEDFKNSKTLGRL